MSRKSRPLIHGPGLKRQGVIILQSLFIAFVTFVELWLRNGVGVFTGVVLLISFYAGVRFGRPGTAYVAVVTPPLALAVAVLVSVILIDGFKASQLGIGFIAALASQAPFLLIGTAYGWFVFLNAKAKKRPYKARR